MKYSSVNKPLCMYMTQSTWYKGTCTQTPVGVLWHSTGANNPTLKRYCQPDDNASDKDYWLKLIGTNAYGNDWNHITRYAGLNAWIGKLADSTVATLQTGPWNYQAWGCGSGNKGSCNNGWIQFEICEDGLDDADYFNKVYTEAVELTAYLCKMFNIDPYGTTKCGTATWVPNITCHQDSYKLGVGSNHSDVNHWLPKFGKSMETVRENVAKLLNTTSPTGSTIVESSIVSIKSGATYYESDKLVPQWVLNLNWKVKSISGTRAVLGESEDGEYNINSPIDTKYLTVVSNSSESNWSSSVVTAVKTYTLILDCPTYSSAGDAKDKTNAKGTYSAGTYYIYTKYPDGVDGMYNLTKDSTGSAAGAWINPAENVKKSTDTSSSTTTETSELYRVRITWEDSKTQAGAYSILANARSKADELAEQGYKVFDSKGQIVYTPEIKTSDTPISTPETPDIENKVTEPTSSEPVYPTKTYICHHTDYSDNSENECKAYNKILSNNPDFDKEICESFFYVAPIYGIDPVMMIAQSILETGWFKFAGSSVSPEQHNYCGLGATGGGVSGASFNTIDEGVNAQAQHLYAYGCTDALPEGVEVYDLRYNLVTRGKAETWEELAGKWACPGYDKNSYSTMQEAIDAGQTYGQKICKIAEQILDTEITDEQIRTYFNIQDSPPDKPDVVEPQPENPAQSDERADSPEVDEPVEGDEVPETSEQPADVSTNTDNGSILVKIIKMIIELIRSLFK